VRDSRLSCSLIRISLAHMNRCMDEIAQDLGQLGVYLNRPWLESCVAFLGGTGTTGEKVALMVHVNELGSLPAPHPNKLASS
jgi:hypothetical protein